MQSLQKRAKSWLPTVVLILFILVMMLLPWGVGLSWAGRSETPAHTLTYSQNKLTWDSATRIRKDGSAELRLFSSRYDGTVRSGNGDSVVAPGTDQEEYVRLYNSVQGEVEYTAVLYRMKSDRSLPVVANLVSKDSVATQEYRLPEGVRESQVIGAVRGALAGGRVCDFDVDWHWDFTDGEAQDIADTRFGNDGTDTVTLGLYITVEDDNVYLPEQPKTGDDTPLEWYAGLMALSLIMLILLLWDRRREKANENH